MALLVLLILLLTVFALAAVQLGIDSREHADDDYRRSTGLR